MKDVRTYIIIVLVAVVALVLIFSRRQNTDYKDKINAIQLQIGGRDKVIDELTKSNLSLQDTFIKYKRQDSLLQIKFKEHKYAKDPNSVYNLPIDSTVSFLTERLSKKD